MKTRSKPSPYPPLAFHATRLIALVASLIVSGIVGWFCYQLQHDGFKLPWTFLIILVGSLLSIIAIALTSIIHCCAFLSPLFNMILNILITLVWVIGFSLLTWNTFGLLSHTCGSSDWGKNDDGMMICRCYKANYSFIIIGMLAQIAMVIVDIRARRIQTALGKYNKMEGANEDKTDVLGVDRHASAHDVPFGIDNYHQRPTSVKQETTSPYGNNEGEYNMKDFRYQAPAHQTTYDSGNYYSGYQR